jgi:hypothetical protein
MLNASLKVYDILQKAGEQNQCCPSNDEIAAVLGTVTGSSVRRYIRQLVSAGKIRVDGPIEARTITLTDSGVFLPARKRRRNINAAGRVQSHFLNSNDIANRVVDNRVCFHCEVRAIHHDEFGCGRVM